LYHQFYNIGVDNNYRFVIGKTTGKYFMFAQDDDWWTPTYIQNLVSELERNLYSPVAACPSQYATAYGKSSPLHLLDHISVFNIIGNGNVGLVCMGLWNREVFIKCEVRLPAYVLGGDHMTVAHAILAYGNPVIADTERYIKGYKNGRFQVCFNNDFWYSFRSWYWFMKILIYSQYIPLHRKLLIPLIAITNFMKAGAVTAVQIIIGLPPSNPLRKYIQSKFFCAN
jgi:hypothetical protein